MRSLGALVGAIRRNVRRELADSETRTIPKEVEQEERTGPDGSKMVLRRTTIEEIELKRDSDD